MRTRLHEAFRIIEMATEETAVHIKVRQSRSHIITLGGEATFISFWLTDRLEEFRALHPEPHRVCRRPFGLSYAAMAGSSSMA